MKVVIMAGGKGSRITSIARDIPKPMIKIENQPILEHEINCLKKQGLTDIIITVGYLGQQIIDYFGDGSKISPVTGKPFGVNIEYYLEERPLGNAGALFKIRNKLESDFLLLNADVIFDIDFKRFIEFHKEKGGLVTLFTHPNDHPYDSGILVIDQNDTVKKWVTKEEKKIGYYRNIVNAGIHIINPQILDKSIESEKVDLDREILSPLAGTGKMFSYNSPEYVKDMGTPERYYSVCKDFKSGLISKKNLVNKQKAIFLDRDGTINKYVGFLTNIKEFNLIEGVAEAIKKINSSEYLVIVVTNQPIIARGDSSIEELEEIHKKLETLLGEEGAYLNAIYFCPHHPEKGFAGERKEYKIECNCRKPKPGMLLEAANNFNIDLTKSWMLGDEEKDVQAGKAAGCKTALIRNRENDNYIKQRHNFGQDVEVESVLDFTKYIDI